VTDAAPLAWIITDGKAGDENPCLGVAEALGARIVLKRIHPGAPWVWLMPWGPVPPADRPDRPASPLAPPYPHLAIATGRRAVAYLRALKAAAGPSTLTVFLRDPRTRRHGADLLWVPAHDRPRGDNILVSATAPHRMSAARLAALRAAPPAWAAALPAPRVAVVLGGRTAAGEPSADAVADFASKLRALAAEAGSFMVTGSRRTPESLARAVAAAVAARPSFVWDGLGENPYAAMLALADALVVTTDSHNMASEAAATGRPLLMADLGDAPRKLNSFIRQMNKIGVAIPFEGRLESFTYDPVDATPGIAAEIARRLATRA
jgi:hypothetical protein